MQRFTFVNPLTDERWAWPVPVFLHPLVWFHVTDCLLPLTSGCLTLPRIDAHAESRLRKINQTSWQTMDDMAHTIRDLYRPLARMLRVSKTFANDVTIPRVSDVLSYLRRCFAIFAPGQRQFFSLETDRLLASTDDVTLLDLAGRCLFFGGLKDFAVDAVTSDLQVGETLTSAGAPVMFDADAIIGFARSRVEGDRIGFGRGAACHPRLHVPLVLASSGHSFSLYSMDEMNFNNRGVNLAALFRGSPTLFLARIREGSRNPSKSATWYRMAMYEKRVVKAWAARVDHHRGMQKTLHDRADNLIRQQKFAAAQTMPAASKATSVQEKYKYLLNTIVGPHRQPTPQEEYALRQAASKRSF